MPGTSSAAASALLDVPLQVKEGTQTTGAETEQEQLRFILTLGATVLGFVGVFGFVAKVKESRYKRFDDEASDDVLSMHRADDIASAALRDAEKAERETRPRTDAPSDNTGLRRGPYPWGGTVFPREMLGVHFALMGAPGSGKTVTMRMLLGAVLRDRPSPRVLLFDPKGDEVWPMLRGMKVEPERIILLNPFDSRSWAWDIAKDFTTPAQAQQLAAMLVPADPAATNPYFWQAARQIVLEVIKVFQQAETKKKFTVAKAAQLVALQKQAAGTPKAHYYVAELIVTLRDAWSETLHKTLLKEETPERVNYLLRAAVQIERRWTLNDVFEATSSLERLSMVLSSTQDGRESKTLHIDNQVATTAGGVLSTLASKLQRFSAVARLWARTPRRRYLSLHDWLEGNCILVIGIDEEHEEAMQALNELLFRRVADLVVHRPERRPNSEEATKPEMWFFLDELRSIGKLDKLPNLLNKGRSKGVRAVLGFQDLNGLFAVYRDNVAKEILATCENFGALALTNPDSREWASQFFSSYYKTFSTRSQTFGAGSHSFSTSEQIQLVPAVPPSVFANLPPASPEGGFSGMFYIRAMLPWLAHVTAERRDAWLDKDAEPELEPGFKKRHPGQQQRRPWPLKLPPSHIRLDKVQGAESPKPPKPPEPPKSDSGHIDYD
jgi:type IV secretory pathway TraG/TraD family ATPase VirD4